MPKENNEKPEIKVTDKRIFTPDGNIREEFREQIRPSDPTSQTVRPPEATKTMEAKTEKAQPPHSQTHHESDRGRTLADKATNPGTPFTNFIEPLIAQAYMSLGMLRNPYQPQAKIDAGAARQMIEILTLLQEKTKGNLTADEDDFLSTHLGELKLAYVQRTKNVS